MSVLVSVFVLCFRVLFSCSVFVFCSRVLFSCSDLLICSRVLVSCSRSVLVSELVPVCVLIACSCLDYLLDHFYFRDVDKGEL